MGRRSLLLIAALLVAALGTTGVFLYVQGVDARARHGLALDKVLIANKTIPQGLTAQQIDTGNYLDERDFLHDTVKDLPVRTDIADLADQVSVAPIARGELILTTQFAAPGAGALLPVPDGMLAVSVALDVPGTVAGFVRGGAKVAVLLTTIPGQGVTPTTKVLLADALVLAAGNQTQSSTTGAQTANPANVSSSLMTFALSQTDAQRLVFAATVGRLSLALIGAGKPVDARLPGPTTQNLFN